MKFFIPTKSAEPLNIPLLSFKFPAGFPSPAADYVETRIDLNKQLIKNPSFTFYAYAEGDSMYPGIKDGNLLIVDRKVEQPDGCIVLASVNNEFCVKHLYRFSDGSLELRPQNPKFAAIHLPCEFEGEFQIFGCVLFSINDHTK